MIYVCSDLHGCDPADFQRLLDRAGFGQEDFLFVLGDVIDRGEHGAELLLWLTQQPNMALILGNHEAMLLACSFVFEEVEEEKLGLLTADRLGMLQDWMANGASPTLNGFRELLRQDAELVWGILDYLREAPLYECLEAGGQKFVLVHAGLGNFRPDRKLEDYGPDELLLDRPCLRSRYYEDAKVIFGHTPTLCYGQEYKGKPIFTDTWICIDGGVSFGCAPLLLRLDDMQWFR